MNNSRNIVRLADISAASFAGQVARQPVILLPLGSHEDHGPHLPMGDYLLADILASRIAESASLNGTACVSAPCLPFGVADYFGASPGSLALSAGSFRAVLSELIAGLFRHGLTKIVILNGHGGNVPVIHDVTVEIKHRTGRVIPSFYLWKIARRLMEARLGPGQEERFGHGAEPVLSLSKALRADFVQTGAPLPASAPTMLGLPVTGFGSLDFLGIQVDAPVEFDLVPRAATQAAWPLASAALGAEIADALVDTAVKFVAHFAMAASISGMSASTDTEAVPPPTP